MFFAAVNPDQGGALLALGQFTRGNLITSAVPAPARDRLDLGGRLAGAAGLGERFYDVIYVLLLLLGGKLIWDGASWLLS